MGMERSSSSISRHGLPEAPRRPLYEPSKLNEVWSMDFMSDSLEDGRGIRVPKEESVVHRHMHLSVDKWIYLSKMWPSPAVLGLDYKYRRSC